MSFTLRQAGRAISKSPYLHRCARHDRNFLFSSIYAQRRCFGATRELLASRPYLLADIGEGITECQIISWLVKPGDQVQEFDPICEVQSDKASVEITSRFDGIVKKLHYEPGDMAVVGAPLLEIDDGVEEIAAEIAGEQSQPETSTGTTATSILSETQKPGQAKTDGRPWSPGSTEMEADYQSVFLDKSNPTLVSPAVRRILQEHGIDAAEVKGTGKDKRVLKEDVQRLIDARAGSQSSGKSQHQPSAVEGRTIMEHTRADRNMILSPVQLDMFKSMTRSLSIPHFLYTQRADLTALTALRKGAMNNWLMASQLQDDDGNPIKLTLLPFVLKALSIGVASFPLLNSTVVQATGNNIPEVTIKGVHNFGIAVDTPRGLVVPVVRNVQGHSILSLAKEISRLRDLARQGKLKPGDMQNATLVVSNIGSIGGQVVAPVILSPMTAIVAVGEAEPVPRFAVDKEGNETVVKKMEAVLSWSADHRVLDGATVARCAQQVTQYLENVEYMGLNLV